MADYNKLLTEKQKKSFFSKIDTSGGPGSCNLWTGADNGAQKRGLFWYGGERAVAARIAWSLHYDRDIPDDLYACHRCDNPSCCNPLHVKVTDQYWNMRDSSRKGRTCRGSARAHTNLNEDVVYFARLIYKRGLMRICDIARWFELSHPACRDMLLGKNWSHVPQPEEVQNEL
jgi:hypothetical protein